MLHHSVVAGSTPQGGNSEEIRDSARHRSLRAVGFAGIALAATTRTVWTAPLSSGQEVPKQVVKDAPAHGLFKATLRGTTLKWKLTFSKLTGPATAAHIHMAPRESQATSLFRSVDRARAVWLAAQTKLTPPELSAFKKHLLYVNVHTAKNPNGEIRGQLARG